MNLSQIEPDKVFYGFQMKKNNIWRREYLYQTILAGKTEKIILRANV